MFSKVRQTLSNVSARQEYRIQEKVLHSFSMMLPKYIEGFLLPVVDEPAWLRVEDTLCPDDPPPVAGVLPIISTAAHSATRARLVPLKRKRAHGVRTCRRAYSWGGGGVGSGRFGAANFPTNVYAISVLLPGSGGGEQVLSPLYRRPVRLSRVFRLLVADKPHAGPSPKSSGEARWHRPGRDTKGQKRRKQHL